jgi:hypothetical protein
MADLFEYAAKNKLRFDTQKGNLTVEDLFDLPLETKNVPGKQIRLSLEELWGRLNKETKEAGELVSPIKGKSTVSKVLETKFAIVTRIIEIKMSQREAAISALNKKARNEQIMRLIADKENDALAGKSIEELKELLD